MIMRGFWIPIVLTPWEVTYMWLLGVVAVPTDILVFCLWSYHVGLIQTNLTTIESHEQYFLSWSKPNAKHIHEYDLGLINNLYEIFGRSCLIWCLPIGPTGDGLSFPKRSEQRLPLRSSDDRP